MSVLAFVLAGCGSSAPAGVHLSGADLNAKRAALAPNDPYKFPTDPAASSASHPHAH